MIPSSRIRSALRVGVRWGRCSARRSGAPPQALALSCCIAASLPVVAGSARAAELAYRAPAGCPSRDELAFRIESALERPLAEVPELSLDVAIHAARGEYSGVLHMSASAAKQQRERTLSAHNCGELVNAIAVAAVLAIGELESARPTAGDAVEPPSAASGDSEVDSPRESAARPAPEPTRDGPALQPGLSAFVFADAGALPSPAIGVALGAGLGLGPWRTRVSIGVLAEQHVDLASSLTPPPGADLGLLFGALAVCRTAFSAPQAGGSVLVCGGLELGQMTGRGTQVRDPQTRRALWAAVDAGLEGRWLLSQGLYAAAQLSACFPLNHDEFVLGALGRVHRAPNLVGRAGLGLGWDWE